MVIVCATSKNIKVTLAIFAQVQARASSDAAAPPTCAKDLKSKMWSHLLDNGPTFTTDRKMKMVIG